VDGLLLDPWSKLKSNDSTETLFRSSKEFVGYVSWSDIAYFIKVCTIFRTNN